MSKDPKPHRVQLSRKNGWRMPPNTKKVDNGTMWGNPYERGSYGPAGAVERYREYLRVIKDPLPVENLRGMNLACWCPLDKPCHADVLLEVANAADPHDPKEQT